MFQSAFPIISTPDLARALGFYRDPVHDPDGNLVIVGSRAG